MSAQHAQQANPSAGSPPLNTSEWVRLYGDYLYNYAMYRVNDCDEAQDLVQETFLSALKAKDSFRGDSSEKTWLVTILKRKVIDFYRKKGTQGIQSSLDSERLAGGYGYFFNEDGNLEGNWSSEGKPQHWSESGCQAMETKEFYEVLNKCLETLPAKWSALFCMKNMEDLDTELICKELSISPSNYWTMMHRAKLQLRQCIEINWFGLRK